MKAQRFEREFPAQYIPARKEADGGTLTFNEAEWQKLISYVKERNYLFSWTDGPMRDIGQALRHTDERSA